ncbi:MAG: hypothetical protein AAB337_01665 [Patescibacteria group bacterium]
MSEKNWKEPRAETNKWKFALINGTWPGLLSGALEAKPAKFFIWFLIEPFDGERTTHDMRVIRNAFYPRQQLNAEFEELVQRVDHRSYKQGARCFLALENPENLDHIFDFRLRNALRPLFMVTSGSLDGIGEAGRCVNFHQLSGYHLSADDDYELVQNESLPAGMTLVALPENTQRQNATQLGEMDADHLHRIPKLETVAVEPTNNPWEVARLARAYNALFQLPQNDAHKELLLIAGLTVAISIAFFLIYLVLF